MAKNHVVIGGGPAGVYAIETIRQCGDDGSITLITDEKAAYSRMALPYWIAGNIPPEQTYLGNDAYYAKMNVTPKLGCRATGVDTANKTVTLDDGLSVNYDTLLIATGSSATRPPIPGADGAGVFNLWTLADAEAVLNAASGTPEVVFVGAGFIGFIVLNAMVKRGWKLCVVEIENQVLPRMLDATGAGMVQNWLSKKGVACHCGVSVTGVSDAGGKKSVALSNGTTLSADVVIMATGIKPNTDFLAGSGITVNQGIVVDDTMQTSVAGVYAAGDVAEGPDLLGGKAIHAIQPTAVDHGRVAGANMAGRETHYAGSLLINVLDVAGLHCASFGDWKGDGKETHTVNNPSRPIYRKLIFNGGRIIGATFVGPVTDTTLLNDVGMVKGLIQSQVDLAHWKDYITQNPLDIRRAYVGSGAANKLLATTLLGSASQQRGYRHNDAQPTTGQNAAHQVLVGTKPE